MADPIISDQAQWDALDQLPPVVRDVLQRAPDPYDCVGILDQWREAQALGWSAEYYANRLRRLVGRTR